MIKYSELEEAIEELPPPARQELVDFIGYLQYKHRLVPPGDVVELGGLWADVDFDVSHDVRSLRRQVSTQLVDKV